MVGLIEIPTAQRGRKRRQCRSRRDSAIGRLSYIMDGANSGDSGQIPEQYSYLSLNTIVGVTRPQTGVHPNFSGNQAARFSGRRRQKSFQVPLRRWAMRDVIAKAPSSLHCIPGPFRRPITCLQVDSIMPDPVA